jgi:hypothetical protein
LSQVQVVPSIYIHKVWDHVERYIDNAMFHSGGEISSEHIKQYLVQGSQTLLIAVDENNIIHGCTVIEWNNYPNERIAFVIAIGGRMIINKELWHQLERWAIDNGATMIRGAVRPSMMRLLSKHFDFKQRYIVAEKKL